MTWNRRSSACISFIQQVSLAMRWLRRVAHLRERRRWCRARGIFSRSQSWKRKWRMTSRMLRGGLWSSIRSTLMIRKQMVRLTLIRSNSPPTCKFLNKAVSQPSTINSSSSLRKTSVFKTASTNLHRNQRTRWHCRLLNFTWCLTKNWMKTAWELPSSPPQEMLICPLATRQSCNRVVD